jgi:hypothetical protein
MPSGRQYAMAPGGYGRHAVVDVDTIRWAVRCRAHRRDGSLCRRYSIRGGFCCPSHGGSAPQVKRKARERLLELAAGALLAAWEESGFIARL